MEVKITGVYDEGAIESTSLIGAEGFSVLIEAGGKKILFDTGRRGRYLLHNMSFLDLKPAEIDKVVISHGHKAHFGGLNALLSEREEPLHVYIPRSAFGTKRSVPESMKLQDDQIEKADIIEISGWMEVADKVFISTPLEIGDGETEAFMVVLSRKGPIVISACSHAGVGKVMESVKDRFGTYPHGYLGGVHIGNKEKAKAEAIASLFTERNCNVLYLNHCTGVKGMMYLRTVLGLKGVNDFYVGSTVSFDV